MTYKSRWDDYLRTFAGNKKDSSFAAYQARFCGGGNRFRQWWRRNEWWLAYLTFGFGGILAFIFLLAIYLAR